VCVGFVVQFRFVIKLNGLMNLNSVMFHAHKVNNNHQITLRWKEQLYMENNKYSYLFYLISKTTG